MGAGAGARVTACRRQFLANLIRAETSESNNSAAGDSLIESTLSVSSNNEHRPGTICPVIFGMVNMTVRSMRKMWLNKWRGNLCSIRLARLRFVIFRMSIYIFYVFFTLFLD